MANTNYTRHRWDNYDDGTDRELVVCARCSIVIDLDNPDERDEYSKPCPS